MSRICIQRNVNLPVQFNLRDCGSRKTARIGQSRIWRRQSNCRSYSTETKPTPLPFAFVFDIDGVLLRSATPLPGAKGSLRYLSEKKIPFLLLTNGGGKLESERASELSGLLDIEIPEHRVLQSHTPFRSLQMQYANKNVLVIGAKNKGRDARKVLEHYGFKRVITPADILSTYPTLYPYASSFLPGYREAAKRLPTALPITPSPSSFLSPSAPLSTNVTSPLQIHLILTVADPIDWAPEIQLVTDLLLSNAGILGTYSPLNGDQGFANDGYQMDGQPPLYFSNPDLLWASSYHLSRLGQGGFRAALDGIWKAITGKDLLCTVLGKPGNVALGYAERRLEGVSAELALDGEEQPDENLEEEERGDIRKPKAVTVPPLKNVYMIGDNPESDIRGANEFLSKNGTKWNSVLVKSGVYRHGTPKYQPEAMVNGVGDAVRWALQREGHGGDFK